MCSSCSSKKNILYLQDLESSNSYSVNYEEYKVAVDDILRIEINTGTPELLSSLNPNIIQNNFKIKNHCSMRDIKSILMETYFIP